MNRADITVCALTERAFKRNAFRCGIYESQDVLSEVENVDLIQLQPKRNREKWEQWQKRLIWKGASKRLLSLSLSCEPVQLSREYDVFIAYCAYYQDLMYLPVITNWKDRCKTTICWIDELWSKDVLTYKPWLRLLSGFDHIVVGLEGTVQALSDAIGRQCHYVAGGVDTLRFCPYPEAPDRVIDVYSIGRTYEGVHQSLLRLAANSNLFYVHDTFEANDTQVKNNREHRKMFSEMAKRSKFMLVAPGKMDQPEEIGEQSEIGFRFYEASAAGAVMLGQIPQCAAFKRIFNWTDSVIEIRQDGSDFEDIVESLLTQPERMDQISRRNVLGSLLQHDWVYRWKQIFRIAGLEPSVAMINREQRLKELANQMNSAVPGRTAVQDLWSKDLLVQKPDRNCELVRHNLIPAYSQKTIPSPLPESRVGGLEEQCRRDKK